MSSRVGWRLLNRSKPESVVAPTATAVEMQAGPEMPSQKPAFPEAMTVAMPAPRRLSMAALTPALSVSHVAWSPYQPPPILMFAEAML